MQWLYAPEVESLRSEQQSQGALHEALRKEADAQLKAQGAGLKQSMEQSQITKAELSSVRQKSKCLGSP